MPILVGTSLWTDKSLIDSGMFYPQGAKKPEDRLRFYASQFPIVEIDSSYYGRGRHRPQPMQRTFLVEKQKAALS